MTFDGGSGNGSGMRGHGSVRDEMMQSIWNIFHHLITAINASGNFFAPHQNGIK